MELDTFDCRWLPLASLQKIRRAAREFYESPAAIGCALGMHRELYDDLRGFDPHMRVWGVEDLDFSLKCWLMGYSILHDPQCRIGHRFRQKFDNYDVPVEHVLVNKLRMADKNFTQAVWSQCVERFRAAQSHPLTNHPEGLWACAWELFQTDLPSADQERAYLHARRQHDEFWYAERFGLSWPRLETRSPSLLRGPATAELAAQAEGSPQPSEEPSPSPCPDKCKDEDFGPKQEGFGIWANTNQHGWSLSEGVTEINPETGQEDEPFDLLRTPVGQRDDAVPFDHYVVTNNPYPNGFILEIEFRFDPEQSALFPPNSAPHRHRPTFLGNSGIGIYSSKDKEGDSQVLYEVQITDCNRMCPPGSNELWQENGFLRMDFTEDWKPGSGDMLGSHLKLPTEPIDLIGQDKAHVDPRRATDFVDHITDDPGGGADCLAAVVAGLPVSLFEDVIIGRVIDGTFERFPHSPTFAESWPVGDPRVVGGNEEEEKPGGTAGNLNLPIGGTEEPEFMNWKHRADFVPTANGKYIHYNKQNSAFWNTLWICFIPPKYDPDSTKRQNKESNACLITKVNGNEVYNGEIKTGTRSARNTSEQHPEQDLFLHGIAGSDYKIRIHGHWGSTVEFRNVSIRPRINE